MNPEPHEVQTETIRYLLAVNAEKGEEIARLTAELAAAPESARRWSAIRDAVATVQAATGLGGGTPLDDDAVAELLSGALQSASRAHCAETALRVDAEAHSKATAHLRGVADGQQARAERAELELAAANAGKARLAEILGFEAESEEANRWKWLNLEVSRLKDELAAAQAERDRLACDAQRWAMIRDTIHRLDAVARPGLPMGDDDVEQVVLLVLQRAAKRGPVPVAPQAVKLHQAWEGTTVCLHCGKPMPWEGMEVCPRGQAELTAARRGPVVEWYPTTVGEAVRLGMFWLSVGPGGWTLRIRLPFGLGIGDLVESGPETGDAGKDACFAAYLKAAGLA